MRLRELITLLKSFCIVLMLANHQPAVAAEWMVQPSLRLGRDYNDNVQLTMQPHNSATDSMTSPRLDFGTRSDIWQVMGGVEAVQKRYSGDSSLNQDDRSANLMTSYNTERSVWQVEGSASKSSLLSNQGFNPDTGAVTVQKTVDIHSINPSWTWSMTELTSLRLSYSFTGVSYVDGASSGLNDYSSRILSAQVSNQLNPKDKIFFIVGSSVFHVPATTFESKSTMYQAGISRTFSDTASGTLTVGTRKTTSEQTVVICALLNPLYPLFGPPCFVTGLDNRVSHDSSSVFNGNLQKKYELTQLALTVSRAIDPSGLGGQVRTDSLNVSLSRNISPSLTGDLSAATYRYRLDSGNVGGIDRNLDVLSPGLHWTWSRELSIDMFYQYLRIRRFTEDRPVSSHAASLAVKYEWPKMSISR